MSDIMKIEVRYHSRGGNTKKIADAIASAVGVEAKTVSEPLDGDTDILFLGTAPYGFDIDDEVKNFVKNINVRVGKVVNFCTSAVVKSTYKYMSKILQDKGIPLEQNEFSCRGEFTLLHKGRPNDDDCAAAADFAKKMISE